MQILAGIRGSAKPTTSLAINMLALAATGLILYVGKPALAPVLFAIVLAVLLSPIVDALTRLHLPRLLSSILTVSVLVATIVISVDSLWAPAFKWVDDAPEVLQKVEQKIRPLRRVLARVDQVTSRASSIASTTTSDAPSVTPNTVSGSRIDALSTARIILVDSATISVLTILLLAGGAPTLRRIESAFTDQAGRQGRGSRCMQMVTAVRMELTRYFSTLALINLGLGVATTVVMALWGLPSPWLWGIMVALLNFVPYVGPAISLAILTIVGLVSFDGYGTAIGVAVSFLVMTTLEGQLIQPLLIGFRLNMNPIMLFMAIWLAGWFWGVAGILLATPTMIALKEISRLQTGPSVLRAIMDGNHAPEQETSEATIEPFPAPTTVMHQ